GGARTGAAVAGARYRKPDPVRLSSIRAAVHRAGPMATGTGHLPAETRHAGRAGGISRACRAAWRVDRIRGRLQLAGDGKRDDRSVDLIRGTAWKDEPLSRA